VRTSRLRAEVHWVNEPSPDAILRAQLILLEWPEADIREALEEDRKEREAEARTDTEKNGGNK
jgi:hypothetical protein